MPDNLHFKISSALKNIIGKDLITDDYIAMFELVKNSYDAHASKVEIYFENIYTESPTIMIVDNGKGMDYNDIVNKWLFVAYSAKNDGTEDNNYDYRNRISVKRAFAGAKGIGRFSCDRLGRILKLTTRKHSQNSKIEFLQTDWGLFESDSKSEFVDISVLHSTVQKTKFELEHGTILEISELRSDWNRAKILKLKDSLSRLISPVKNEKTKKPFTITIYCDEEASNDNDYKNDYDKVNGEVKNFIFEALELKTTRITSSISEDGKYIKTELTDGGTMIYSIKENNPYNYLENITYTLYYLNHSAKMTFALKMGVNSVNYGHVFMYKNGFRIYPYGEPGEDSLGVDKRKGQGYNRFLGTRELLGQIDINSTSIDLTETTSRGDGFIRSKAYEQLIDGFYDNLRRLERYVVDVQQWGLSIENTEGSYEIKERITELLARLSGSNSILEFDVPNNIVEILDTSQINSAETLSKNLSKLAYDSGNDKLILQANKISGKILQLQNARLEAFEEAKIQAEKARQVTQKLKEQISENLFLKSINTGEYKEVISLLHHIGIFAGTIDNNLKNISLRIQNDIPLSREDLNGIIKTISFETKKILNVVSFATKANFNLSTEQISVDLAEYFREYITNIIPTVNDSNLKIICEDQTVLPFIKEIKPIEINIIIDNLINNSKKAKANNILVNIQGDQDDLNISFTDDGEGIPEENFKRIYDFGFTTTDGSGLGLYHVNQIIKSLNGKIKAKNNTTKGVTFTLNFKKA